MKTFKTLNYFDSMVTGAVVGFTPAIMRWAFSLTSPKITTIIMTLEGGLLLLTLSFMKRIEVNRRNAIIGTIVLLLYTNIALILSIDNPTLRLVTFTLAKGLFVVLSIDLTRYLSNLLLDQNEINSFDLNKRIIMSISGTIVGLSMATIVNEIDIVTLMVIETIILDISCICRLMALLSIKKEVDNR